MKIWTLAGALALCAFVFVTPVRAEVPVGEEAPDFEAKDCINTEPLTFADLKGRLILLELFTTT